MNTTNSTTKKTVIVTASSKGIGKGAAIAFAKKGYNVVVSARSHADDVLKEIKDFGGEAIFIKADATKEEDIKNLIDQTVKHYGRLDVLVNNAGGVGTSSLALADTTTENFEEVFRINVLSTFWGMKYAIKEMLKTGGGNIVNVSSAAGLNGVKNVAPYSAVKHAVNGLTKSTAIDYATQNIRVNAICPGPIKTEMFHTAIEQGYFTEDLFASMTPMNKVGDVEGVANAIVFLGSNESPFMTGSYLVVDGGLSAL